MHPMRGATVDVRIRAGLQRPSIHAPHVGCSNRRCQHYIICVICLFNPCTPCGAQLAIAFAATKIVVSLQSMHPVWGATSVRSCHSCCLRTFNPCTPCGVQRASLCAVRQSSGYFNPCTPCGVQRSDSAALDTVSSPSIHAPRVGCNLYFFRTRLKVFTLQSMHPIRGATFPSSYTCRFRI